MSQYLDMHLVIRLPLGKLFDDRIIRLNATASIGNFGILPNHIDHVTDLTPSVLVVITAENSELYFGIDEGLLVKTENQISVITRRGIQGHDLSVLQEQVRDSFMQMTDSERVARSALSRLEADMVRRFSQLQRGMA